MYATDRTITRPVDLIPPPEGEGDWDCPAEDTAGDDD